MSAIQADVRLLCLMSILFRFNGMVFYTPDFIGVFRVLSEKPVLYGDFLYKIIAKNLEQALRIIKEIFLQLGYYFPSEDLFQCIKGILSIRYPGEVGLTYRVILVQELYNPVIDGGKEAGKIHIEFFWLLDYFRFRIGRDE
jgi:hypothetical protein